MIFNTTPATHGDAADLALMHIEGWRAAYGGLAPQPYLDSLNIDTRADDWRRWMAEGVSSTLLARNDAGHPAGFISFGKLKTPPPGMSPIMPLYSSEIYALYILPDYWRQGLGRRLMTEAAQALKAMKHTSLCLWVLDGNARANAFYKAIGGQRCGKTMVDIGGAQLKEVVYGWRDTKILL